MTGSRLYLWIVTRLAFVAVLASALFAAPASLPAHASVAADVGNQIKKLTAADGVEQARFGAALALEGDTLVIGAFQDLDNQGSAYVFDRNLGGDDNWGQVKKLTASDGTPEQDDTFGSSVAISGDIIVVGAPNDNTSIGAAYVFKRDEGGTGNWGEIKKLVANDGVSLDLFGIAVSISGDTIIVGAYNNNDEQGSAYIFQRDQGGTDNWGQVTQIFASDGTANDEFGISVAISGGTAIVGAHQQNSNQGAAYVFLRNQGGINAWGEVAQIIADDGDNGDFFGIAVAIDGNLAIVGASGADVGDDVNDGAAYLFSRNQGGSNAWGQIKKLTAADGADGDSFGFSVAMDGSSIAVGAVGDDVSFTNQGSAYLFLEDQGGTDNWGQFHKLNALDGNNDDRFGVAVAVEGDLLVAGAHTDDIGSNPNQGSAYVMDWTDHFFYLPLLLKN